MWTNILFDLDGTLIDSGLGVTNAVRHALNTMNLPVPPQEELRRFIGPPLQKSFLDFCGLSGNDTETAIRIYREYYGAQGIRENEVYPGIPGLLYRLRAAGKTLYVATSKPTVYARQILEDLGLAAKFADIAGSGLGPADEGKAQIIARLLQQHGIPPATAVMVGDRHFDVDGAKTAGIASIGILFGGYGGRLEMQEAGADFIAKDVGQLENILLGTSA